MKEDYLKIVLLLLLLLLTVVVAIEGYFLYNLNRIVNEKHISVKAGEPLVLQNMVPFIGFFDKEKDTFIEIERIRREMQKRFMDFENLFQTVPSLNKFNSKLYRTPSFDMKEQDGKYIITMEIPGIEKDAINIKTEDGKLIVSANVSQEKDNNTTTYYQRERLTSSYRHVILLPTDADEKSLSSKYKNGLLIITFEKAIP